MSILKLIYILVTWAREPEAEPRLRPGQARPWYASFKDAMRQGFLKWIRGVREGGGSEASGLANWLCDKRARAFNYSQCRSFSIAWGRGKETPR